jgi:hypothetical protein
MFALLVKRAAELADRQLSPGTHEEEEFDRLVSAIEAYEAKRWPDGRPRHRRPAHLPTRLSLSVKSMALVFSHSVAGGDTAGHRS